MAVSAADSFFTLLTQIPNFDKYVGAGLLIFARILALFLTAPVFSRKDIPIVIKVSFALLLTFCFTGSFGNQEPPQTTSLFLSIILNVVFGALTGLIANMILNVVEAAGEMINMQMGLQAASMFDSNTRSQTSIMGRMFTFLGIIIYMEIGGLYWLFEAFQRGFEIFPLYGTSIPLDKLVNLDYIIMLSSNVMFIGFQIASPILIATLCQDVILGIISKVAPQVNVFQLSFVFKPVVGAVIFLLIIPMLVNTITDYLYYYSHIF
jgi:flagellar biosynthetic protein FliR